MNVGIRDFKVIRVHREIRVRKVYRDSKEILVIRGIRVYKEHKGIRVLVLTNSPLTHKQELPTPL